MSFAHYTRTSSRKALRRYAFLICESCYSRLSVDDQQVYAICTRDCGTSTGCERCQDESETEI
jgi:hypothetical protein